MKDVRQLMEEQQPDVVLASTHQKSGHGLQICTRMRKLEGGDCLMVVHGSVPEGVDSDELKAGLGQKYKVDHWLNNNASPALVALTVKQLLKSHLANRPRRNRRPMAPPLSLGSSSESSERRLISRAKLQTTGEFEVEFKRPTPPKREP
jgi:CheY-like chemotaxis protein